ncbi:TetR/AcrR family transcriptional regulator [Nocardia takedensis]|uniref:TetR/AcrR family transcriptional regulator n=1 Tax=Nocardia takedensis TaxID=259390 RepID=UPI000319BB69|nr:TetR/AcrR family transcriptional regulator [Nocardia takedensis]
MSKQFSSVWTRPTRRPKAAGLSREQIVAAAIELLDAEGLAALSMRKLGARLDAGATSLYWHVATKDDLLELALDEFWGTLELGDPTVPWREFVTAFAHELRRGLVAHPWAASLVGQLPSMGPKALRLTDRLHRAFMAAGFTGTDVALASGTVLCFVLGQVIPELAWTRMGADQRTHDQLVEQVLDLAADYPEMVAEYRASPKIPLAAAREVAFDFGLVCALDGLAARLRRPGGVDGERVRAATEG